jgi:hypothetical protein
VATIAGPALGGSLMQSCARSVAPSVAREDRPQISNS